MKKFLTILSLSTILTISFAVASCKVSNSNQKINNKKEDSNKNNNKNIDNNNNKIEKTEDNSTNKNKLDKQKEFLNNWNKVFIDSPTGYDIALRLTKEQKAKIEKIDSAANDFKKQVVNLIENKDDEKIKDFSKNLVFKNLTINSNEISTKTIEYRQKIQKMLDEFDFESIKKEITLNFSNSLKINEKSTEENKRKLDTFLSEVKQNNKEKIFQIINELYEKSIKNEIEEKIEKFSKQISDLLAKKLYKDVEKKIFKLIEDIAKLQKKLIN
ncbi:MAG6090-like repeat-containing lipoprotein [Mycoplasma capricolum]|uniref:MAG6090-like repeat-containing lipoprotein n=1 Tax=Mycoplasma capricolum TaxID=2095 RepID=UPI003DA327CB